MTENLLDATWVPTACTLPTVDQPRRVAEFDSLFAQDTLSVNRTAEGDVELYLRPDREVVSRAADLAAAETSCCSFFAFDLAVTDQRAVLRVGSDKAHAGVLDALADRASALAKEPAS